MLTQAQSYSYCYDNFTKEINFNSKNEEGQTAE